MLPTLIKANLKQLCKFINTNTFNRCCMEWFFPRHVRTKQRVGYKLQELSAFNRIHIFTFSTCTYCVCSHWTTNACGNKIV